MVFSSTIFLFAFLPITLAGYYLIRKDLRNAFLLLMSLLFYAAGEPKFVFIMTASIVVNYLLGLAIHFTLEKKAFIRRIFLVSTVLANLGLLFYYKYFDFTVTNLNRLFHLSIPLKNILLPIGISFFTFQGMSYVLDVYMKKAEVQKNPLNVALYIAFFPQLIAGPIVRYSDVNMQIISRKENFELFGEGVIRFVIGLAKKIILSNQFAVLADFSFDGNLKTLSAGMAWLGAFAYAFQIYFDFSGYSDMAIGLGKMFGFNFNENFNYPYIAKSVQDFWRRWHISLSSWFRDYVYIPMGGNRTGNVYFHLITIFFLTGLWHGASWHYIAWGLWHGMFLLIERFFRTRKANLSLPTFINFLIKHVYTILVVLIGWVLFRGNGLKASVKYIFAMFGIGTNPDNTWTQFYLHDYFVTFVIGIICALPTLSFFRLKAEKNHIASKIWDSVKPVVIGVLFVVSIAYTVTTTYNPFIYFNF